MKSQQNTRRNIKKLLRTVKQAIKTFKNHQQPVITDRKQLHKPSTTLKKTTEPIKNAGGAHLAEREPSRICFWQPVRTSADQVQKKKTKTTSERTRDSAKNARPIDGLPHKRFYGCVMVFLWFFLNVFFCFRYSIFRSFLQVLKAFAYIKP